MATVSYLTPIFARMALETIEAWYKEQKQEKGTLLVLPDTISTLGMNRKYLFDALNVFNVDMELLEREGIVISEETETAPSEIYQRDTVYTIDVANLRARAYNPEPA
jgi:hypothetical protein